MRTYYIDTNIFIYFSDTKSPFNLAVRSFFHACKQGNDRIVTSCETIQEIIHYAKKKKQLKKGITLAKKVLHSIDALVGVDTDVIKTFMHLLSKYPTLESRDVIHIACCKIYQIDYLVSLDRNLGSKCKEITIGTPADFNKIN